MRAVTLVILTTLVGAAPLAAQTDLTTYARPDHKVEKYYAAGDVFLEKAFSKAVEFWNGPSGQNLDLARGAHDVYLPPQLASMSHHAADAMERRLGNDVWIHSDLHTGLIPNPNGGEDLPLNPGVFINGMQLLRFPLHASDLLAWFPTDLTYRKNASASARATKYLFDVQGGGLHPLVDAANGQPAGEVEYVSGVGFHLYGMARIAYLTGDTQMAPWLEQKVDFVWSGRPTSLAILPDRYTRDASLPDVETSSTDTLYYARRLYQIWDLTKGSPAFAALATKCLNHALAMTDQWNATGWLDQYGHYTTHIDYDGSPAEFDERGDSKWNTLYVNAWARRATGQSQYVLRFKKAWEELKSRSRGPSGLIDEAFVAGTGDGVTDLQQTAFVDALLDMYDATQDPYFLNEAIAHGNRLVTADVYPVAAPAVPVQLLRLALATHVIRRLEINMPAPDRKLFIKRNGTTVLAAIVPAHIAVVYLPDGVYNVRVGATEQTVNLHADLTVTFP